MGAITHQEAIISCSQGASMPGQLSSDRVIIDTSLGGSQEHWRPLPLFF